MKNDPEHRLLYMRAEKNEHIFVGELQLPCFFYDEELHEYYRIDSEQEVFGFRLSLCNEEDIPGPKLTEYRVFRQRAAKLVRNVIKVCKEITSSEFEEKFEIVKQRIQQLYDKDAQHKQIALF